MRALAIVHQPDAGPGVFAEEMNARGVELDTWPIPEERQPPADPFGYDAVLTFGGAMNVHQRWRHRWIKRELALLAELLERGVPLLGACLGNQLLAEAAGGEVRRSREPEIGWHRVTVLPVAWDDPLLGPIAPSPNVSLPMPATFEAFQWHSYEAVLPPGAVCLASTRICPQAYRIGERAWGIQFHAEVTEADANKWTAEYREDPDAVRIGLDPDALRAETAAKIADWNRFGRELCGRFLEAAA